MSKRATERKIRRLPVTFTVISTDPVAAGGEKQRGTSSDFSESGIFIRTRKVLKPGTHVQISVELDDNKSITLKGVVARSVKLGSFGTSAFKDGIGVRLTDIKEEYLVFVEQLKKE
jgi:hypothetical protein